MCVCVDEEKVSWRMNGVSEQLVQVKEQLVLLDVNRFTFVFVLLFLFETNAHLISGDLCLYMC